MSQLAKLTARLSVQFAVLAVVSLIMPLAVSGQLLFRSFGFMVQADWLMNLSNSITTAAPIIRSRQRVALVTVLQLRTVLRDAAYPMGLLSQTADIAFVLIAPGTLGLQSTGTFKFFVNIEALP